MRMKEEFLKMLEGLNEKTERKIKKLEDFIFFLGTFQNYFSNKKLIKKNSDIAYILEKEFNIKFAEYVKKSRPLILGKSIKYFFDNINDLEINDLLNTMYKLLSYQIEGKKIDSETWDSFIKILKKETKIWIQ